LKRTFWLEKGVVAFEKEVLPFEKGVLAFEKGVLPFEKGVLAFATVTRTKREAILYFSEGE
jgi:hypothetical protein